MRCPSISVFFFALLALFHEGSGIYCHRCSSSMGGCGEDFSYMMFRWRACPDSEYCVKVVEKYGSDTKIIRECENELLKSTRHRLRMPVLRRHGDCKYARKNDPYNPEETSDNSIMYCYCWDFNGCNAGENLNIKFLPVAILSIVVTFLVSYFV